MSSFLLVIVIAAGAFAWAAASLAIAFAFGRAVRRAERELAGSRGARRPPAAGAGAGCRADGRGSPHPP
ncbi:hypothetical protein B7R22_02790 [Subtercola boreus]|uniref:Uncharacterized protein n=1 Tax=Subtercola boreus TaxID=120213 RepID=A0A3E0W371_9MICO|nr:hypothetical protein [Subtercola boreus]RFA16430.1 hypothetical protein B7R22_02790 [Subtercola boreus]